MGGRQGVVADGPPLRRLLGIASGVLGWSPDVFWASTPHETYAAISGWRRANDPKAARDEQENRFQAWADQVRAAVES
ncbi:phage tail assembly chaperone [Paramagnetospirillum caucaseum]|uniref:phage tail assembly chaperone n=1 Tax=Paramagnetospirillum caucaseum TaxID=1244869 RepID=UPI0009DAE638|nr:phage tail assembly chaperone [Paramagnetospirillum caucaseum]